MKSIRLQLLVTLVATVVAAALLIHRGPPPGYGNMFMKVEVVRRSMRRSIRWGVDMNARDSFFGMTLLHEAARSAPEITTVSLKTRPFSALQLQLDILLPLLFTAVPPVRFRKTTFEFVASYSAPAAF